MARKAKHFTQETVATTDAMFERAIARVGGHFDSEREARFRAIHIDGTPIGVERAPLRGSQTSAYAQGYLETRSVARLMLDLDLDLIVTDVQGSDKPDVTVIFADRSPVYVEQTNVMEYDGTPFGRHLEQINVELETRREGDEAFRKVWERGMLTVRMTDPGVAARPARSLIVNEIAALSLTLDGDIKLLRPSAGAFPALRAYNACIFYSVGLMPNPNVCNVDGGWVDPHPEWVATRLRGALAAKRDRASGYKPDARPLWLLLNLDGPQLIPSFVPELVRAALDNETLAPFDRVLVSYAGIPPISFSPSKN